ncbi:MAG: hypothetical protein CVU43_05770 [Chloroflexi bacterium HGW-Chloroflexi-5]|jgi:hypothetical protein|nr:MAG: hypothetical protein CVU43_05770 [Chloroflexi bacterium HGW-Chloroflexi-5]
MDIEELKTEYIQLGGNEADVKDETDVDTIVFLCNLQKSIAELDSDSNDNSENQSDLDLISNLKAEQEALPYDSELWRMHQNAIRFHENKLRSQLGLQPKPFEVLDSDLSKLLQLDGNVIGQTCREFLHLRFPDDAPAQKAIEHRLTEMKNTIDIVKEQQLDKAAFDNYVDKSWESLKVVPVRYTEDSRGKLIRNPKFRQWYDSAKTLQQKLNGRIHYLEKMEDEGQQDVDRREKLFKVKKELDQLLEQQGVTK